jgi:heme oxygenase
MVLEAVRAATSVRHGLLEALPISVRLLADDLTIDEYRATLARMYGFYAPLAQRARLAHVSWATAARDRAVRLAEDLSDLDWRSADLEASATCDDLPALDTADRALGCAYVLEGAALGGRVIRKHLMRVFGERPDLPLRFMSGNGEATGPHWQAFCAELDATARDVAEVCTSALATFDAMGRWLAATPDVPAAAFG